MHFNLLLPQSKHTQLLRFTTGHSHHTKSTVTHPQRAWHGGSHPSMPFWSRATSMIRNSRTNTAVQGDTHRALLQLGKSGPWHTGPQGTHSSEDIFCSIHTRHQRMTESVDQQPSSSSCHSSTLWMLHNQFQVSNGVGLDNKWDHKRPHHYKEQEERRHLPSSHKLHIKNVTHLLFECVFHQTCFKISIDAIIYQHAPLITFTKQLPQMRSFNMHGYSSCLKIAILLTELAK